MFGAYLLELGKSIAFVLITVFLAFGGFSGIASLVTWRWKTRFETEIKADFEKKLEAFKAEQNEKVQKVIETHKAELQKEADELSQKLSERINRRSKAFEIRLNKQYEFYEKYRAIPKEFIDIHRQLICDISDFKGNSISENQENTIHEGFHSFINIKEGFETLIISYYAYLDNDIFELSNDCYNKITSTYFQTYRFYELKKKDEDISNIEIRVFDTFDEALKRIKELGAAIRKRIEADANSEGG